MQFSYPLVNIQKAIENGQVEIVDLPSYKMVDLSIVFCLPEGIYIDPLDPFFWEKSVQPWSSTVNRNGRSRIHRNISVDSSRDGHKISG